MTAYHSDVTGEDYSKTDFLRLLEQRIRKHIRLEKIIDLSASYVIVDEEKLTSQVLAFFLKRIFADRITLCFTSLNNVPSGSIVLDSSCLEEYIDSQLSVFSQAKSTENLLHSFALPLRFVSAAELTQVAEMFSFSGIAPSVDSQLITALSEKYPQTKTSLQKSFDHIAKLLEQN